MLNVHNSGADAALIALRKWCVECAISAIDKARLSQPTPDMIVLATQIETHVLRDPPNLSPTQPSSDGEKGI